MMQSNSELTDPLTASSGSNDNNDVGAQEDAASQSSQRSLLERIRMQRQREAEQNSSMEMQQASASSPATEIRVPQYNPIPTMQENFAGGVLPPDQQQMQQQQQQQSMSGSGNFFSQAWNNIQSSMEQGMAQHPDDTGNDALLAPTTSANRGGENEYSMSNYFMTMVRDVYNLFLSLPVWARWIVILVLLYIALRLL